MAIVINDSSWFNPTHPADEAAAGAPWILIVLVMPPLPLALVRLG